MRQCTNGACGFVCNAGYVKVNNSCEPLGVDCCGPGCVSCPQGPEHTVRVCNADTECNFVCDAGYHLCGETCVADDSPTACGDSCMSCPGAPNGAAICSEGSCAIECNPGHHMCGDECHSDEDPAACGAGCAVCPGVSNGAGACVDGVCAIACDDDFFECEGECVPKSTHTSYVDEDGDGFGSDEPSAQLLACSLPEHAVGIPGDCDDYSSNVFPGAKDVCNGLDEDCDGRLDENANCETGEVCMGADGCEPKEATTSGGSGPGGAASGGSAQGGSSNDRDPGKQSSAGSKGMTDAAPSDASGGCGCRVAGAPNDQEGAVVVLAGLSLAALAMRRRRVSV